MAQPQDPNDKSSKKEVDRHEYAQNYKPCPAQSGICIFIPTSEDNLDEDVARAIKEYEEWKTQWKQMLGDKCWLTTMTRNKGVNWKEAYAHLTPAQKASRREFTDINRNKHLVFGDPPIKDLEVEVLYLHDGLNLVCSLVHGRWDKKHDCRVWGLGIEPKARGVSKWLPSKPQSNFIKKNKNKNKYNYIHGKVIKHSKQKAKYVYHRW